MSGAEPPSAARGAQGRTLARLAAIEVGVLEGIGPKRLEALEALGITSVLDLLWHYPRRYIDRTRQADLAELAVGDEAVVLATVTKVAERRTRQGRSMVTVDVDDGTGAMSVTFFNQSWRRRQLAPGAEVLLFGKLADIAGWRERHVEADSLSAITAVLSQDEALAAALSGQGVQIALDQVLTRGDAPVSAASEVAYLPPMSGG